jgi:hypothetical protein
VIASTETTVLSLAERGWYLVPIRPAQENEPASNSPGKNPGSLVGTGWQHKTSCEPTQIERWIKQHGECNWGLLLGPKSGVWDLEYDTPEGREIIENAVEALGGILTPSYSSAKSVHRLFQHDERIQELSATNCKLFGTEWRFGDDGHQSVIPPSVHESGTVYTWLPGLSPDAVEAARLPDELWELFLNLRRMDDLRKAEKREAKQTERKAQPVAPCSVTVDGVFTSHVAAAEAVIAQIPFDSLLATEGWTHHNGDEWTRPGSDWSNAKSATLSVYNGQKRLTVWTNAAPIEGGTSDSRSCYSGWRFWYTSNGFLDRDQINAAKAFLGEQKSKEIDSAYHNQGEPVDTSKIFEQAEAKPQADAKPQAKPTFEGKDISDLEEDASSKVDWLVDGMFSSDQPTLFGAKSKCLKTTLLVDLTVALGSGSDWLGVFKISRPRRVLFITGESNYRAISRRLLKSAKSRGLKLSDLTNMVRIEAMNFPKLPNLEHCVAVEATVQKYNIEVVIVDPLYRGMTAKMDTNKVTEIGDAIVSFASWCHPASLICAHHTTKASARELGAPPDLEDMTGAGIAESFGNWWLMGRNQKYAWDWKHDLCVQYGGRDEQAGGRRILFNESTWTAEVSGLQEFVGEQQEAAQRVREDAKREKYYRTIESARARVQAILRDQETPVSKRRIEEQRGEITQKDIRQAIWDMESDLTLTLHNYKDRQNRFVSGGYMLAENGEKYDSECQAAENSEAETDVPVCPEDANSGEVR